VSEHALLERVARIKDDLAFCAADPRNKVKLQPVPASTLDQLADTPDFPLDMHLILRHIGEMLEWGITGCAAMEWWTPCDIDLAREERRCFYDVRKVNFMNGDSLLFFAWDCDAKVYFYDTTTRPWKIVASDGLGVSGLNLDQSDAVPDDPSNLPVTPWAEELDFISLVEIWARWGRSCTKP
jgi:hypothetical protein